MTKKILSMALAIAMVMALSVTAFAADNSISVTGVQKGETYNIYKMMDLSVDLEKGAYRYTVNSEWAAFFAADGASYIVVDDHGYVTWNPDKKSASDMEDFGKLAAAYAANKTAAGTAKPAEDNEAVTFTGLENGYYLITSTNGTFAMIDTTPDNKDVTVNEKNADHKVVKVVKEDSKGTFGEANDAQIGDVVEYQLTVTLERGAKNAVLHDTMTDGLTFNNDVAISGLTKGTDYTVDEAKDGCTFHVVFAQEYLDKIDATTVLTVTYTATLNEKAADLQGDTNTIQLTWGDASSAEDAVTTTTHKVAVHKYAAGDNEKALLPNATFKLLKAGQLVKLVKVEGDTVTYRVAMSTEEGVETFTTNADGDIVILGLDADADYELEETVAPEGYNLLNENVSVTVAAENNTVVDVANQTGVELPSTGGIGTTIFYALGAVMVIGAGVLLVAKKRMSIEG